MERRWLLLSLGLLLGGGGCLFRTDSKAPVHFELWNQTDADHEAAVTVRKSESEVVLDRTFRIGAQPGAVPGGPVIRESAITEAANDTLLEVAVELNGRSTWAHLYRVTCSTEDPENRIVAEIIDGREPSVRFDGSHCG